MRACDARITELSGELGSVLTNYMIVALPTLVILLFAMKRTRRATITHYACPQCADVVTVLSPTRCPECGSWYRATTA